MRRERAAAAACARLGILMIALSGGGCHKETRPPGPEVGPPRPVAVQPSPVSAIAWEGGVLATGGADGRVRLWRMPVGENAAEVGETQGPVAVVAVSRSGARVAAAGKDARVWDVERRRLLARVRPPGVEVTAMALSPDGETLATDSGRSGYVCFWNAGSGRLKRRLYAHKDTVTAISFSADGARFATSSWDHHVKVWQRDSDKPLLDVRAVPYEVVLSPNGDLVAIQNRDESVEVMDARTGAIWRRMETGNYTLSASFHPQGDWLVTTGPQGQVFLWDTRGGRWTHILQRAGNGPVQAVFAPDGSAVAVGSHDGQITLWPFRP